MSLSQFSCAKIPLQNASVLFPDNSLISIYSVLCYTLLMKTQNIQKCLSIVDIVSFLLVLVYLLLVPILIDFVLAFLTAVGITVIEHFFVGSNILLIGSRNTSQRKKLVPQFCLLSKRTWLSIIAPQS